MFLLYETFLADDIIQLINFFILFIVMTNYYDWVNSYALRT